MRSYNIDIVKLTLDSTPPVTRVGRRFDFLKALLSPLKQLKSEIVALVDDSRYQIAITGQVIALEQLLNDAFDNNDRRIYIEDGNPQQPPFLYTRLEGEEIILNQRFEGNPIELYTIPDYSTQPDFIIWVPSVLLSRAAEIKAKVNRYVLAGKQYTIIPIT